MDGGKSGGIQGCECPAAFPRRHPLGENNRGWSWSRDAGGDGRDRIQPLGPHPATEGKPLPGESSRLCLQFDPSPSVVRHRVFTAHGFVPAMQEPAAENGENGDAVADGRLWVSLATSWVVVCIQGCHHWPGDMGSVAACWEQGWG